MIFRLRPGERLLLASSSPRRLDLLQSCGLTPLVDSPESDERVLPGEGPAEIVRRLSLLKARVVAERDPGAWVIGGDTIVVTNGEVLGKPVDEADAARMLRLLQGTTHEVWGGFAVVSGRDHVAHSEVHTTRVTFTPMSEGCIRRYVASGEPLGKAGSYAIQGLGVQFVSAIEGSYTNVVGLNLPALLAALQTLKVIELTGHD